MLRPARKALAQKAHQENPMNTTHYIGFDVHKKTISFCVKTAAGEIVEGGSVPGRNSGTGKLGDRRDCPHFISESRILSSARHSPLRIPPQNS